MTPVRKEILRPAATGVDHKKYQTSASLFGHDGRMSSVTDQSDPGLVERTRRGDTAAFAELWRRHAHAALTVARSHSSTFDADDLVSEAYAKIYQAIAAGGGPTSAFRAYLFTTIRNIAASWGRATREDAIDDLEKIEDPAFSERATMEALDRSLTATAFRALPTRWQEVLWYCEVESMTPQQVAPLFGMTPNAVSALAYRAKEGLRQAWVQAHIATMPEDSDCRWTTERLGSYARNGTGKREAARVRAHLEECTKCGIVAAEASEVGSRLALVLLPLTLGIAGASEYAAWIQSGANAVGYALGEPGAFLPGAESGGSASAGSGGGSVSVAGAGSASGSVVGAGTGLGAGTGVGAGMAAGLTLGGVLVAASVAAGLVLGPQLLASPPDSVSASRPGSDAETRAPVVPDPATPAPSGPGTFPSPPRADPAQPPAVLPVDRPTDSTPGMPIVPSVPVTPPAASAPETPPPLPAPPIPSLPTPTTPPSAPIVTAPAPQTETAAVSLAASGTATPDAVIVVSAQKQPASESAALPLRVGRDAPPPVGTAPGPALEPTVLAVGTTTADATGAWALTLDLSALDDGDWSLTYAQTTAAGSSPAQTSSVSIDRTAEKPELDAPDTGTGAHVGLLTPILSGTAEPHATVDVYDHDLLQATVTASADGSWTTGQLTGVQPTYGLTAVQTDRLGNVSPVSDLMSGVIPLPYVDVVPGHGATFLMSATSIPGTRVTLFENGSPTEHTLQVDAYGHASARFQGSVGERRVGLVHSDGERFGPLLEVLITLY